MTNPGGYDSEKDTRQHIEKVRGFLHLCAITLQQRSYAHDESKLRDPEKAIFDEYTPKLAGSTYGSDEYKQFLTEMKPALDHHYAANSHHPEHWPIPTSDDIEQMKADNTALKYCSGVELDTLLRVLERLNDGVAVAESRINGMSLLDIVEMICDWAAACQRHADGDLADSLRINKQRFGISDQLASILENTVKELGWL